METLSIEEYGFEHPTVLADHTANIVSDNLKEMIQTGTWEASLIRIECLIAFILHFVLFISLRTIGKGDFFIHFHFLHVLLRQTSRYKSR